MTINLVEDDLDPVSAYDFTADDTFFSDPQGKFPVCEDCPFFEKMRTRELKDIYDGCDILIVGNRPTKQDIPIPISTLDPQGPVGAEFYGKKWYGIKNFIKNYSSDLGNPYKISITTSVMCHNLEKRSTDDPVKVIRKCGNLLNQKIALYDPKVILLMGRQACKATMHPELSKLTSIDHVRGHIYKFPISGKERYLIPTRCIDEVNKNPDLWGTLLRDLHKSLWLMSNDYETASLEDLTRDYVYYNDRNESKCIKLLDDLLSKPKQIIAADLETSGLSPYASDAEVLAVSLAWAPGKAAAIATCNISDKLWAKIKDFFESDLKFVFHNSKFDCSYLKVVHDIHIKNLFSDTMLNQYLVEENRTGGDERTIRGEYTLKKLVWDFLPEYGGYEEESGVSTLIKAGKVREIPTDDLLLYAALDTDVTLQILYKQLRVLLNLDWEAPVEDLRAALRKKKKPAQYHLGTNMMPRASNALVQLETIGMAIDMNYLKSSIEFAKTHSDDIKKDFEDRYPGVNINSTRDLKKVVYDELGFEPIPGNVTKSGNPYKLDYNTLKMFYGDTKHDDIRKLMSYRKFSKLGGTFFKTIQEGIVNGRVHPSYNLTQTVTGRLSCSRPNLQNMPEKIYYYDENGQEQAYIVKKLFCAEPGNIIIASDYSQIEMVVLAGISGDEDFIGAIKNDLDLHCFVASKVFGVPYDEMYANTKGVPVGGEEKEPYKTLRKRAKIVGFGIVYGKTSYGLSKDLEISKPEAQEIIDALFNKFPKIQGYIKWSHRFAQENGYVETPFGRRRHFPIKEIRSYLDNKSKRQAQNSIIQSTASDICLRAVTELTERLPDLGAKVVTTVHDSILVECPEDRQQDVIDVMQEIMIRKPNEKYTWLQGVPIRADYSIGPNWADQRKIL